MLIGNIMNHTFSITSQKKILSELSNGSGGDLSGDKSRSSSLHLQGLGSAKPPWNFCG